MIPIPIPIPRNFFRDLGKSRDITSVVIDFSAFPNGSLPILSGPTWSVASGKAINTPTLGAENFVNGNMEVITGWVDNGTATTFERSNEQAHGGTYSLKTISDALNEGPRQIKAVTQWTWHSIEGWVYLTSGSFRLGDMNGRIVNPPNVSTPTGAWQKKIQTGWASVAGNLYGGALSRTAVSQFYFDDASWKQIDTTTMPASFDCGTPNVIAKITATIASYAWIGLWICQNASKNCGIVACHNGAQVALLKLLNGVWSELIAPTAASFGTGLEIRKYGTVVKLFSNGIQIGADQTVSDVDIIHNTIHGPMSTHPDNQLLTLSILPN